MEIMIQPKINTYRNNNSNKVKNKNSEKTLKILDFFLENEINISNRIRKINNFSNYYLVIYDYQFIDIGSLTFEVDINRTPYKTKDQYVSIEKISNKNLEPFNSFIERIATPKMYIYKTILSYQYLLTSIHQLNKKKLCYFNFSSGKIKYYNDRPLLTDFSNSFCYKLWDKTNAYKFINNIENLNIQPIEIVLLFYMDKHDLNVLTVEHIDIIILNYYEYLPIKDYINKELLDEFKINGKDFLSEFIGKSSQQILHQTVNYIDTWDNYNLGIHYVTLFYRLIQNYNLEDTIINKLLTHLLQCIDPVPIVRKNTHYMMIMIDKMYLENQDWNFVNSIDNVNIKFNAFA